MNKFKITVTTALLGLSLMRLSTYSYEFTLEQAKNRRCKDEARNSGSY
ncbi:Uncharacterised protein [Haemophilus influenzae]|nr:hypothetical protein BVZ81_01059 [Haemophilus influenzae]PRI88390.1 hypothetical protein BV024_01145 [Haemophilus influenzae]PRJ88640.1 hypothetical protein BV164_01462 [Haemophilus influenzae]PRK71306.1 hypothetical protein BV165_00063 [Haemophilus influenzae]PRL86085.1 hypothetical protein BV023_01575 [Haemophilus influenzae]